ncbi:MAG: hypothetical protein ACI33S_01815 [Bacilli bacterium]
MGSIAIILMYSFIIGVISIVLYFIIKKAIKDALKECKEEKIIK